LRPAPRPRERSAGRHPPARHEPTSRSLGVPKQSQPDPVPRMIGRPMARLTIPTLAVLALALPASGAPAAPVRFALVELYTSEGCSSCPPADELLARLATDATRAGNPVAALSFHVTYWNQLGWMDRFSDEAFTQRQRAYAHRFELKSLYTPQMIVDGGSEFVGSNAAAAERALHEALAHARSTSLVLEARADHDGVSATCHVASAPAGSVLWIAWADAAHASAPDGGENQGRRLHHVNVVRALERVSIDGGKYAGTIHLRRPEAAPGMVVAWVQRGDVGAVVAGATSAVAVGR